MSTEQMNKTACMAVVALMCLKKPSGCSLTTISKHIRKLQTITKRRANEELKATLEKGVSLGAIRKVRGRYVLNEALQKQSIFEMLDVAPNEQDDSFIP